MATLLKVLGLTMCLLISLSSCQKSWTCTCTKNAPPADLTDDSKSQAIRVCEQYQNSVQVIYPAAQCQI